LLSSTSSRLPSAAAVSVLSVTAVTARQCGFAQPDEAFGAFKGGYASGQLAVEWASVVVVAGADLVFSLAPFTFGDAAFVSEVCVLSLLLEVFPEVAGTAMEGSASVSLGVPEEVISAVITGPVTFVTVEVVSAVALQLAVVRIAFSWRGGGRFGDFHRGGLGGRSSSGWVGVGAAMGIFRPVATRSGGVGSGVLNEVQQVTVAVHGSAGHFVGVLFSDTSNEVVTFVGMVVVSVDVISTVVPVNGVTLTLDFRSPFLRS